MRLLSLIAGLSLLSSLCAKWLADAYLTTRVAILGSFAGLQHSENPGIAFGLRLPGAVMVILITLALVLLLVAAVKTATTRLSRIAFGLLIGGALGNILDRVFDGRVTDFFQVGSFPVFNVADSCITVGAGLLILEAIIRSRKTEGRREKGEGRREQSGESDSR